MNSISTFDITKYPLLDILKDIKTGRIQLPDFQRDWVWDDSRVRRLLSSISLAYPVGAVMLLQQENSQLRFKPRPVDGATLQQPPAPNLLILDGQQRLTTLFMVLLAEQPLLVKGSKSNKISRHWYYLDIEKALDSDTDRIEAIVALPESKKLQTFSGELIDASTPQQEFFSGLFPLSKVFSFSSWRSEYSRLWDYSTTKLKLIDTFEQEVLKKFEHYQMPVIQLRDSLPKDAVCQVFEDTNTSGYDLNYFDLMSASYCADNFSLRDDWKHRELHLKSLKVLGKLRNTDFLQAVTLVASYSRRKSAIRAGVNRDKVPAISCRRLDVLKLSTEEYQTWADSVTRGFEEAARFLYTQKIFDANDLAYPIQLVALAAILTVLGEQSDSEQVRSRLGHWLWSGMLGEMYTRGPETQAAHDVLEVPIFLLGSLLPTTLTSAECSAQRLLSVRKRYGAVFQGLTALLRREGAIDWSTGEEINDVLYFEQQVESHHIFPVSWCKQQGIDPKKYNSLVNRTPLSAKTNKKIGGKPPSAYLRQFEMSGTSPSKLNEMLRSHAIDPSRLRCDDFEGFFVARTQALMELMAKAMGKRFPGKAFEGSCWEYKNGNINITHQTITLN
ncbi:MAG: DUF262 domain-containing protein [Coleofasciculus sp. S288]|nr:DUF262 domain-containing protein [Coleofasciculus sp. S288]